MNRNAGEPVLKIERTYCDVGRKGIGYRWFITFDGRLIAPHARTRIGLFIRLLRGAPVRS